MVTNTGFASFRFVRRCDTVARELELELDLHGSAIRSSAPRIGTEDEALTHTSSACRSTATCPCLPLVPCMCRLSVQCDCTRSQIALLDKTERSTGHRSTRLRLGVASLRGSGRDPEVTAGRRRSGKSKRDRRIGRRQS
eukprot:4817661-Prymnesium_polylepis.1